MKPQNQFKVIVILILVLFLTACTTPKSTDKITSEECDALNGRIVNTLNEDCPSENIIGEVTDLKCPCVCCKDYKLTENNNFEVTYSIGSGWTGMHKTIKINNDGLVNIEIQQPLNGNYTNISGQISSKELQELKDLVSKTNVFNLEDEYYCQANCPTDTPGFSIKFLINDQKKEISGDFSSIPEDLNEIIQKINDIEDALTGI
ncbi:MAG: hypothetical protein V1663_00370 [archaeon]